MSKFIATFFGVGNLPKAPGTWGSLAALPVGYLLHETVGFYGFAIATVAVFLIGWWATAAATKGSDNHDPSEIVIDEVAGQWIALLPVSLGATHAGADMLAFGRVGLWRLSDSACSTSGSLGLWVGQTAAATR